MQITIPAALAGCTVHRLYHHETRCGVAYAADLKRDGRLLGRIENDGNGGGTWFYPASPADREMWEAACAEFVPQAEAITNADFARHGLPPIEGVGNSSTHECLADVLFDLTD